MRIQCNRCGKSVSNEVINKNDIDGEVFIRAWVECPECIEQYHPEKSKLEELREEFANRTEQFVKDFIRDCLLYFMNRILNQKELQEVEINFEKKYRHFMEKGKYETQSNRNS